MMLILNGVPPDMEISSMRRLILESCGLDHCLIEENETRGARGDKMLTIGVASERDGNNVMQKLNGIKIGKHQLSFQPYGARQQSQPTFQKEHRGRTDGFLGSRPFYQIDTSEEMDVSRKTPPWLKKNNSESLFSRRDEREQVRLESNNWGRQEVRPLFPSAATIRAMNSTENRFRREDAAVIRDRSPINNRDRNTYNPHNYQNSAADSITANSRYGVLERLDISSGVYGSSLGDGASGSIVGHLQPSRDISKPVGGYRKPSRFQDSGYPQTPGSGMNDLSRSFNDRIRSENQYDKPINDSVLRQSNRFQSGSLSKLMDNSVRRPSGTIQSYNIYDKSTGDFAGRPDHSRSETRSERPIVNVTRKPGDYLFDRNSQRPIDSGRANFGSSRKRPSEQNAPDINVQIGPPPMKRPYNDFSQLYESISRAVPLMQNQILKPLMMQWNQPTKQPVQQNLVIYPAPLRGFNTQKTSISTNAAPIVSKPKYKDTLTLARQGMDFILRSRLNGALELIVGKIFGCKCFGKKKVKPEYKLLLEKLNIVLFDRLKNIHTKLQNLAPTTHHGLFEEYRKIYSLHSDQKLLNDLMISCQTTPLAVRKLQMEGPFIKLTMFDEKCTTTKSAFLRRICSIEAAERIVSSAMDSKHAATSDGQYVRDYFKISVYDRMVKLQKEIESEEDALSVEKMCNLYNQRYGAKTNRKLVDNGIADFKKNNPRPFLGHIRLNDRFMWPRDLQQKTQKQQNDKSKSEQNGGKVALNVQSEAENVVQKDGKVEKISDIKLDKFAVITLCSEVAEKITLLLFYPKYKEVNNLPDEEKKIYKHAHEQVKVRLCSYSQTTKKMYTEELYLKYFLGKYKPERRKDLIDLAIKNYYELNKTAINVPYRGIFVKGPGAKSATALWITLNILKTGAQSYTELDAEDQKLFAALYGCVEDRIKTAMNSGANKHVEAKTLDCSQVKKMYRMMYSQASDAEVLALLVSEYNGKMPEPYTGKHTDVSCNKAESSESRHLREYFCRHLAATAITASVVKNSKTELIPHLGGDMGNVPYNHVHSAVLKRLCDIYIGHSSVEEIIEKYRKLYNEDDDEKTVADAVTSLGLTKENTKFLTNRNNKPANQNRDNGQVRKRPMRKAQKDPSQEENTTSDLNNKVDAGNKVDSDEMKDSNDKADCDGKIDLNYAKNCYDKADSNNKVNLNDIKDSSDKADADNKAVANIKIELNPVSDLNKNSVPEVNSNSLTLEHAEDKAPESSQITENFTIDDIDVTMDDLEDY